MKTCIMAVMLATLAGRAAAQPVQWRVEDGGNGHWYEARAVPLGTSWDTSAEVAVASGGYLATITDRNEDRFVYGIVGTSGPWFANSYNGPFLGGFRRSLESPWEWVTGEPFAFSAWCSNQPSGIHNYCPQPELVLHGLYAGEPWCNESNWWGDLNRSGYCDPWLPEGMRGMVIEWSADCNNDGIVDKGQILSGDLPDANNNGIPDGFTIAAQPVDQNVGVDVPVTFIVEVASDPTCTTPVTFQWQRRNPLVADPAAANAWIDLVDGSGFFGTTAANLSISRPIPALATGYRCRIGGGCGCEGSAGGVSYTNTVNFSVACPGDFNADGGIDFGDVEAFFERWENGC